MSSKVKQANFRLPLAYMDLIDEIAQRESITKAAVITRALDCLKDSFDSGNGGMPVTAAQGIPQEEYDELKAKLAKAERRADDAASELDSTMRRLASAEQARDAAEARAREASISAAGAVSESELMNLRDLVARREKDVAAKDVELAEKSRALAERDVQISSLKEELGAANARVELAQRNINVEAVPIPEGNGKDDDPTRALAMLNMIGGVMNAFQQQVDDARAVGEQEGRMAIQRELQDMVEKARNDGYRDAMGYLDDRVTTARDSGMREERARIANMGFFERRRYLRMHIA